MERLVKDGTGQDDRRHTTLVICALKMHLADTPWIDRCTDLHGLEQSTDKRIPGVDRRYLVESARLPSLPQLPPPS